MVWFAFTDGYVCALVYLVERVVGVVCNILF